MGHQGDHRQMKCRFNGMKHGLKAKKLRIKQERINILKEFNKGGENSILHYRACKENLYKNIRL